MSPCRSWEDALVEALAVVERLPECCDPILAGLLEDLDEAAMSARGAPKDFRAALLAFDEAFPTLGAIFPMPGQADASLYSFLCTMLLHEIRTRYKPEIPESWEETL